MTIKQEIEPNLIESLGFIKKFHCLQDFLEEVDNASVSTTNNSKYNLKILVPILYRLGLVKKALILAEKSIKNICTSDYELYQNYLYNMGISNRLGSALEQLQKALSEFDLKEIIWNSRVKSFFSIIKKGYDFSKCDDLLGIECSIDKKDFFSEKLNTILSFIFNKYDVVNFKDLLYSSKTYKYIPYIITLIKLGDVLIQFKIKSIHFDFSELGTNYFIHKNYNIDSLQMTSQEELNRTMLLNSMELQNNGNLMALSESMFEEVITGKYYHLLISDILRHQSENYTAELALYRKQKELFYSNKNGYL